MDGIQESPKSESVLNANPLIGTEKKCVKCQKIKILIEFPKNKIRKDGLDGTCKLCHCENSRVWAENNRDRLRIRDRERYRKNPEKFNEKNKRSRLRHVEKAREASREYYILHSEEIKAKSKRWYEENKERALQSARNWHNANPDKVHKARKKWDTNNRERRKITLRRAKEKARKTLKGRLNNAMACGIWASLNGAKNRRSWESLVGYTWSQLKIHLEKQFTEGMTWDNYGISGWHIDHIIPKYAFNFKIPEDIDFNKYWDLKNLRPLWAEDNHRKGANISIPFQPSLLLRIREGEK